MSKWEMVKLGDVFLQIRNGASIKQETSAGGIPITRIETIASGEINLNKLGYANISDDKFSNFYLADGDILMSHINSIKHLGKVALYEEVLSSTPIIHGMNLLCLKSKILYPKFSLYFFRSDFFKKQIPNMTKKSVNQASFTVTALKLLEIPLPTLEEQKKIAQELDSIQSLIAKRKEQLEKMDLLVKAKFVEMFGDPVANPMGWEKQKLSKLSTKITDGKHGGCNKEDGSGFYFVGAREIYDGKVNYETAPQIPKEEFDKDYKRCNIENGDFVIVNTGATIGKSAILNHIFTANTLLQKSVALIKPQKKILSAIYLMYCYSINTKMYDVKSASAQPNLLLSQIKETVITLPPINLQNKFADYVQQTETLKTTMRNGLEKLELLYNSKMQEYFG